ncbi:hypothetical protein [Streptomyces albidoflavus]|uniref:hypothetical protein n=1 Tax=Streptomyces albidoflavus TaxID=1886 RepID=UPI0015CA538F|nr:hypothetical protein [Streptomyces albidoflavus]
MSLSFDSTEPTAEAEISYAVFCLKQKTGALGGPGEGGGDVLLWQRDNEGLVVLSVVLGDAHLGLRHVDSLGAGVV